MAKAIVIRDAGGVGDIIRIFAVIDALCVAHDEVTWVVPSVYASLARCCVSVGSGACVLAPVAFPQARRSPLDKRYRIWGDVAEAHIRAAVDAEPETRVVDLFCPALAHEVLTECRPTIDRVACWLLEAGMWPVPYPCVTARPPAEAEAFADSWWRGSKLNPRKTIALSAASVRGIRTWRNGPQSGPSRAGKIGALLGHLHRLGWTTLVLDHADGCRSLPATGFSVHPDHPTQMAIMRRCAGYIGPDSGFLHAALAMDMRAVGLFGPTDGELVLAPYPSSRVLILRGEHGSASLRLYGCDRPCYGMRVGGYRSERCGAKCGVLEGISETMIAEAADKFFRRRDEGNTAQPLTVHGLGCAIPGRPDGALHHRGRDARLPIRPDRP